MTCVFYVKGTDIYSRAFDLYVHDLYDMFVLYVKSTDI